MLCERECRVRMLLAYSALYAEREGCPPRTAVPLSALPSRQHRWSLITAVYSPLCMYASGRSDAIDSLVGQLSEEQFTAAFGAGTEELPLLLQVSYVAHTPQAQILGPPLRGLCLQQHQCDSMGGLGQRVACSVRV